MAKEVKKIPKCCGLNKSLAPHLLQDTLEKFGAESCTHNQPRGLLRDGNVLWGPHRIFAQRAKLDPWRDGTGIAFLPDCAPGTPCYLRKHSLARRFLDQTGAHFVRGGLHPLSKKMLPKRDGKDMSSSFKWPPTPLRIKLFLGYNKQTWRAGNGTDLAVPHPDLICQKIGCLHPSLF